MPDATMPTIIPHLVVKNAAQAIDYYKKVFGAEELHRMPTPDGRIMHAGLRIGDSSFFVQDEMPEQGWRAPANPEAGTGIYLNVKDCDATYKRAVDGGAKSHAAPQDMFWGARWAMLTDPFGQSWQLGQQKEQLTPQQIAERARKQFGA